jgi:peptide-methionine (S)-S-oxide reductase
MRLKALVGTAFAALAVVAALPLMKAHSESAVRIEAPALDAAPAEGLQTAVIAGGCFWGIQAVYQHTKGVTKAVSGYAGGEKKDADYQRVSSARTGHAEAVQITFDPKVISYGRILQIFFSVAHNPTELNRQGPDSGPQYRTEIFPQSEEQAKVAKAYTAQLDAAKAFPRPIVTKTGTMKAAFYPAEGYHQDYAFNNPRNMYIVINDAPKVENLKRMFPDMFREKPVLVADAN